MSFTRSHFTFFSVKLLFQLDVKVAKKAILEGFRKTDELLLQKSVSGGWQDGATAVCVWILDQKV
jgi:integrin-linked kinase-associated serine/threonine phosphatase 2C